MARPTSLAELLDTAQRLAAEGACQDDIVQFVYDVAERHGVRVRHDVVTPARSLAAPALSAPVLSAPALSAPELSAPEHSVPAQEQIPHSAFIAAADPTPAEAAARPAATRPKPAAAPPAATQPAATQPAATQPAATQPAAAKRGGRNGRSKLAQPTYAAPIYRQRDGSYQLEMGRLFDAPGEVVVADPGAVAARDDVPPARDATVGRLVLSGRRGARPAPGAGRLAAECSGVVVDARTWRVLAAPPGCLNPHPPAKVVDAILAAGGYDVTRVDDGTVVTLYCWPPPAAPGAAPLTWALASSNGYDVSTLRWFGPLTYAGVVHDLLTRHYPDFAAAVGAGYDGARLTFTGLDPACCYTIGFRHHNFHPVLADPERVWLIQCRVAATGASAAGPPGLPTRTCEPFSFGDGPVTLAALRATGEKAFERAVEWALERGDAAGAGAGGPLPDAFNYGYVLRARDPAAAGAAAEVLVETPLLTRVRRLFYERAPAVVCDSLTADTRLEYNAMRAFLTAGDRADFADLCGGGWADRFRTYEEFTDVVTSHMVHATRQRALAASSREPALASVSGRVARALLDRVSRRERLPGFSADSESIFRDHVLNPEYAYLYLRALREAARHAKGAAKSAAKSAATDADQSADQSAATDAVEVDDQSAATDADA